MVWHFLGFHSFGQFGQLAIHFCIGGLGIFLTIDFPFIMYDGTGIYSYVVWCLSVMSKISRKLQNTRFHGHIPLVV